MFAYHGLRQARKRTGLNTSASANLISKAIDFGKTAEDFHEREREYLLKKANPDKGKRAVVKDGFCFILGKKNVCITVHRIPGWFGKKTYHVGKQKIREPKKYMRYYNYFERQGEEYGIC